MLLLYNAVGVGYAAITEADDTLSGAAALALLGTLTATEDDDTLSGASVLALYAELSITEPDDTMTTASTRRIRKILRNVTMGGHI